MAQEDQIRESIEVGIQRLGREVDQQVRGLMDQLWRDAVVEKDTAIAEARRVADADGEQLRAEIARTRTEADQRLAAELGRTKAEAEQHMSAELARARTAAEHHLAGEVAKTRAEIERQLAAEVAHTRAEAEGRLTAEIARVREEAERQLAAEVSQAVSQASHAHAQELSRLRGELERSSVAHVLPPDPLEGAGMEQLLRSMRALDHAQSLTESLDLLAEAMSDQAGRVGILLVQGSRAQPWRLSGFGEGAGPDTDHDAAESSLIARTIDTGEVSLARSRPGNSEPVGLHFAPLPHNHSAVAVPVQIGGRVMAIAYADDVTDGATLPAAWPDAIEALVRHASRCLEALTALRASQAASFTA